MDNEQGVTALTKLKIEFENWSLIIDSPKSGSDSPKSDFGFLRKGESGSLGYFSNMEKESNYPAGPREIYGVIKQFSGGIFSGDLTIKNMSEYRITADYAESMIKSYCQEMGGKAISQTLGGQISKIGFLGGREEKFVPAYKGVMAWFCLEEFGELFLAFEEFDKYDKKKEASIIRWDTIFSSKKLIRSYEVFGIPKLGLNKDINILEMKPEFIRRTQVEEEGELSIWKVRSRKNRFLREYKPELKKARFGNKYPYGFFENEINNDVRDFLAQDGLEKVRYYFGIDSENQAYNKTNAIRIILVGVDKEGKNLIGTEKNRSPIILQKSWPPPPDTF